MDLFLENIFNHNDEYKNIVYPSYFNMENYALNLESAFYNKFKVRLNSSTIKYTDYRIYKKKSNVEPDPRMYNLFIVDPECYIQELKRKDSLLGDILQLCKKELDK